MNQPASHDLPQQHDSLALPLGPRGDASASASVWTWQQDAAPDNGASARAVRLKGAWRAVVGFVAAGAFLAFGHTIPGGVVATIAAVTLLAALASPLGAFAAIERGISRFARGLGQVVGWIVLMPVFLLFFVPYGLLFRRGANDPMKRAFDSAASSYFRTRSPGSDPADRPTSQF